MAAEAQTPGGARWRAARDQRTTAGPAGLRRAACWLCGLWLWATPWPAGATEAPRILDPDAGGALIGWLAEPGFDRPLEGGLTFDALSIERDRAVLTLHDAQGAEVGSIALLPKDEAQPGDLRSASFALRTTHRATADETARGLLARARASIIARDDGSLYHPAPAAEPQARRAPPRAGADRTGSTTPAGPDSAQVLTALASSPGRPPWAVPLAALGFSVLLGLGVFALHRAGRLDVHVKPTHALPFAVQSIIFVYWGLYWRGLLPRVPMLVVLLALGVALDGAASFLRGGRWRITLGPLPIVGSCCLLVFFGPGEMSLMVGLIALAIASKHLLRRGGRHIFNPSALALSVLGLLRMFWPELGTETTDGGGTISHVLSLPANMTALMLGLALLPQTRLPIALMTVGCALGLTVAVLAASALSLAGVATALPFTPMWPPVLLVLLLLITDPATSPRTGPGRLLYGVFIGLGMALAGELLVAGGFEDHFGKVFIVPLANAWAPRFDRMGATLPARASAWLSPTYNRAHIGAWLALAAVGVMLEPARSRFAADMPMHANNATRFITVRDDGTVHCADNPLFCNDLSIATELGCWLDTARGAPCGNIDARGISAPYRQRFAHINGGASTHHEQRRVED
jgi:hypothetical protein